MVKVHRHGLLSTLTTGTMARLTLPLREVDGAHRDKYRAEQDLASQENDAQYDREGRFKEFVCQIREPRSVQNSEGRVNE